jgi:hypothetical protein
VTENGALSAGRETGEEAVGLSRAMPLAPRPAAAAMVELRGC